MRTMPLTKGRAPLLLLLTLAGCVSLGRESTALEQYVLAGPPPPEEGAGPSDRGGLTLAVRRVDLPSYLASPAIVVRRGAHQIGTSEFHRWGESPAEGITRTLTAYLASLPGVGSVDAAPWTPGSEHDYLLQLRVSRFEGAVPDEPMATEGEARLTATWEILDGPGEEVLARGVTDYREGGWSVGDYSGLVTRLDRGLTTLARDLVTCIGRLPSGRTLSTPGSDAPPAAPGCPVGGSPPLEEADSPAEEVASPRLNPGAHPAPIPPSGTPRPAVGRFHLSRP